MASHFTEKEIAEIKNAFCSIYDVVTTHDIKTVLGILGQSIIPSDAYLEHLVKRVAWRRRHEGIEGITLNHFIEIYHTLLEDLEHFKRFDKDGSGRITVDELRHVMTRGGTISFPEQEIQKMMSAVDTDGDGKLNYHEFLNIRVNF